MYKFCNELNNYSKHLKDLKFIFKLITEKSTHLIFNIKKNPWYFWWIVHVWQSSAWYRILLFIFKEWPKQWFDRDSCWVLFPHGLSFLETEKHNRNDRNSSSRFPVPWFRPLSFMSLEEASKIVSEDESRARFLVHCVFSLFKGRYTFGNYSKQILTYKHCRDVDSIKHCGKRPLQSNVLMYM